MANYIPCSSRKCGRHLSRGRSSHAPPPLPLELRHDEHTARPSPRHREHRFDGAPAGRFLSPRQRHVAGDPHDPRGPPHGRGVPYAARRIREVRARNRPGRSRWHAGRSGCTPHRYTVDSVPRRGHHRRSRCHSPTPRPRRNQRLHHPRGARPRDGPPHARGHRRPHRRIRGHRPARLFALHGLPRPVRHRPARRGLLP